MVLVGLSDLDEETVAKYPGVLEYGQCQSRAFFKGMVAFFAGGAAGLTASYAVRQRYPNFPPLYNVVFVAGGAIVTSYLVASIASKQCQRLWVNTAQQHVPTGAAAGPQATSTPGDLIENKAAVPSSIQNNPKRTKYGDQME